MIKKGVNMKKGFSLVELIISIVLLTIVLLFMLGLLIRLNSKKEDASDLGILVDQAIITKKINGDILNLEGIESVNCDATSCLIVFGIGQTKYINLSVDKKTLTYGTISEIEIAKTLPKDYEYDLVTLSNNYYSDIKLTKIVISVKDNPKYNIEIYDSSEIELAEDTIYDFDYTGDAQIFTAPATGLYKIELWGAEAGVVGGKGGYSKGEINLLENQKLYIYVGQRNDTSNGTSFNGGTGTSGGVPGGGATDIRLKKNEKYRYVRDYLAGSTANGGNHWVEIKVFDKVGNNIALGKTISSNSTITNGSVIVDGVVPAFPPSYGYTAGSYTLDYIEVDLGAEYEISSVQIWHYFDGRTYNQTKTELYNASRTVKDVIFDSSLSGTYAETATGRTYYDLSLANRIMVAGGGGSAGWGAQGGAGGGLTGYDGSNAGPTYPTSYEGFGGTQTVSGLSTYGTMTSGFGYSSAGCAGGGGYYGGGGAVCENGAGGGSSFISGHNGCNAINIISEHTGQSVHFSGYSFTNTTIIDGAGYNWTTVKGSQVQMPNPAGSLYSLGQGHSGNGHAKITLMNIE